MATLWERIMAESYSCTTETQPLRTELENLEKDLTCAQREQLARILYYKDILIADTARTRYEAGFLDGMELLCGVCQRRHQIDDG